jgi:hypothetical protein
MLFFLNTKRCQNATRPEWCARFSSWLNYARLAIVAGHGEWFDGNLTPLDAMHRFLPAKSNVLPGLLIWATLLAGCAQVRIPQIDPLGRSVFVPSSAPLPPGSPVTSPPPLLPSTSSGPAFQNPPTPQPCTDGSCGAKLGRPILQASGSLISHSKQHQSTSRNRIPGTLTTTPSRIVAPVGAEVVVLAGVCGNDGYYMTNQPLEWMLSHDSAGQIVEVGGMDHSLFNQLVPPSSKKFAGDYAWGRTGLKPRVIDRGTDTPVDDIQVEKGQTWLSLTSASAGTSYLTCVAPRNEAWPERKSTTYIHWVDAIWSIPMPSTATAGTIAPLDVAVNRSTDGTGVADWKVRYQIVGGVPAEFHPSGEQLAEVTTNAQGHAPIQIRQPAGQAVAGPTQVRVEIVRPSMAGEREVVLESGITTVNWSSPALTIRAIGPRTAGINQPFNYRIEVSNPGDQVARDVTVSTEDISGDVEYISSSPKPGEYGNRYEWKLGDINPGSQPQVIEVQLRSAERGKKQLCFEVASQTDQLKTEACAETEIAVPCIGLKINGPTQAKVGDQATFSFDITNQCDQPLENITVRLAYDEGLAAIGVSNPVEIGPIERLAPGQVYNLPPLVFQIQQSGTRCYTLEVRSAGGDTARARRCIEVANVTEPKVRVDMQSQRTVRVGEQVLVQTRITNAGNVPLDSVNVIQAFSRSLTPVQRSPFPQSWIGDDMAFDIGRLEPGQSQLVEVLFNTTGVDGDAFCRTTVTNPNGVSEQTGVSIRIEPVGGAAPGGGEPGGRIPGEPPVAIPADPPGTGLRVNVVALDRTVAVRNNASFQVTVVNDRPVTDQNVVISFLIPPGARLQPLDPAQVGLRIAEQSADGTRVRLEPRAELRAGETLRFPVTLQMMQEGAATFEVQVTSARSPAASLARQISQRCRQASYFSQRRPASTDCVDSSTGRKIPPAPYQSKTATAIVNGLPGSINFETSKLLRSSKAVSRRSILPALPTRTPLT